ncbi:CLUMA_CG013398, isoform A [Clunio marinus]|uniref:CLUMA_CG013398, isoform A n=1 Tax=Clunio marinus TaxID=568069 RepID=A0A1J1IIQ5_9DIPT|nr:CLUMA_CG013398, isoform A [Clunio marinus]
MGKCASKDQHLEIREIDERSYIAIVDDFDYYGYEYEGQSESKKSSKKMSGPETKGTSISFGFKKKNYSSSASNKKFNAANNNNGNDGTKSEKKTATIISNHNVIKAEQNHLIITSDDNGNNNNPAETNNSDKETTGRTTPRLQPPKRDQTQTSNARGNRFGFRQNVVRPAAAGITPKFNEYDKLNNNSDNGGNVCLDNDKRRSKSATASSRSTVTFAQSPIKSSSEERPQQGNNNTNKTRPQAVVLSRYTLHSTSLPRPQYPIPVSVSTTTAPSYKRSTTFTSFSSNGSGSSSSYTQNRVVDTKGAKHAANISKRGGIMGRRDESLDSGIASHDSNSERQQLYMDSMLSQRPRQRSRHFEMVPTGRHKFEIRDLSDYSDGSIIVPLSLPKLPTNRNEIVTGGLIRSYTTDNDTDMSVSVESNTRPTSIISTSEAESFEEEKSRIDNSFSEKSFKGDLFSKNSSRASSKASWFGNINESMASKNCSSLSVSSSDENVKKISQKKDIDCDDDELSSMTITADFSSQLNSSKMKTSPSKDQKEIVNDAFMQQQPKIGSISRKELLLEVDDVKFAATVDKVKDSVLLDDETSPTDSLVSSSESGDVLMKKIERPSDIGALFKTKFDDIKEQDLEDVTPELISPLTPGSPAHGSNSLSLSDGVRDDFLIDDEIADQPNLVMNDKKRNGSASHNDDYKTASMNLTSDTGTLKDISLHSNGSIRSANKPSFIKIKSSPAVNRKGLGMENSGSLDTLSPCDSITSDDLMADFDVNSSLDSIDRHGFSHDDLHVLSDFENRNTTRNANDFDAITKIQQTVVRRHSSRESITRAFVLITKESGKKESKQKKFIVVDLSAHSVWLRYHEKKEEKNCYGKMSNSCAGKNKSQLSPFLDARRLKTDLHTSENVFLQSDSRSRSSSPILPQKLAKNCETSKTTGNSAIRSQLPARATRLLNRRLQSSNNSPLSHGSESPRSLDSMHSRNTPVKTSLREHLKQRQQMSLQSQMYNSSSEDVFVDKQLRNSMLQDVTCFKKQLVHLRRILQEDEDNLMRSDTLNPFEVNGQIFNGNNCENVDDDSKGKEKKDDQNNVVLSNEQMALLQDQRQELADLRRQVVFLQSQMDDKDRTIRIQQNKLEEYEKEKSKDANLMTEGVNVIETATCATQTERLRPISMGQESLTRSSEHLKDPPTTNGVKSKQIPITTVKPPMTKSKTQISSIYTKLSSIKPSSTSLTSNANSKNLSSASNFSNPKPVKTTQIGNLQGLSVKTLNVVNTARSPIKSPKRIPQLVKPNITNGASKISSKPFINFKTKPSDSNGNSATSSLSTSSSNSSLNNTNGDNISKVKSFI